MHDWTLMSIRVDWHAGVAIFDLKGPMSAASLVAHNFHELKVPRQLEWGPSVSVNRTDGPTVRADGQMQFAIEMQSGDVIEVVAGSFELPPVQRAPSG